MDHSSYLIDHYLSIFHVSFPIYFMDHSLRKNLSFDSFLQMTALRISFKVVLNIEKFTTYRLACFHGSTAQTIGYRFINKHDLKNEVCL